VTNAWAACEQAGGRPVSLVVVESATPPLHAQLLPRDPRRWRVVLPGFELGMPAERLPVLDGLVLDVALEAGHGGVQAEIRTEHPAAAALTVVDAIPARVEVRIDRRPLAHILSGRTVALEPAHGGGDLGARGPINLVEKDVVLDIGRRAAAWLRHFGGQAVLLREDDAPPPRSEWRRRLRSPGVACCVAIHTGHGPEPGTRACFGPFPGSRDLAARLLEAVRHRLERPDRGMGPCGGDDLAGLDLPAAAVEVAAIGDLVEEALFRSIVFRERAAQAIARGVKNFLATGRA
jgi:N-acetylmuramoyl-L-alanine amidase